MFVFYDTCDKNFYDQLFVKIATAGRHKNVVILFLCQHKLTYLIYVNLGLFRKSKQSQTIDLPTTHLFCWNHLETINKLIT